MFGRERRHGKKREFYFKSCDGVNRIHTVEWSPEDDVVRAVLHIVHGMAERVERYDDLARFMADEGVSCCWR